MPELLAGTAKTVITPPVGHAMGAWVLRQGRSKGVHDDLYARALVLSEGETRIGLVAMDVAGVPREIVDAIKSRVSRLTDVPPSHLLLNSTHNHTTPSFGDDISPEQALYAGFFAERVAGAVAAAANKLAPASVGFAWGDLRGATVNRQYRERPVDTDVGVLRVDGADGRPIARVVNWACHNLCAGGQYLEWTADFTGVTCDVLERAYPGSVCLFLQGAAGDVHPFDWWFGNTESKYRATHGDAAALGRMLAGEAMKAIESAETRREVALSATECSILLPRQEVSWSVEEARRKHEELVAELGTYEGDVWPEGTTTATAALRAPAVYGKGLVQLRLAENQDAPPVQAELQAFRIGDLRIACNPGELFNELGSAIKTAAGRDLTWVASYCNDSIGYISTRRAHEEAASVPLDEIVDQTRYRRLYGTTTSPFAPEAGEMVAEACVKLLRELDSRP